MGLLVLGLKMYDNTEDWLEFTVTEPTTFRIKAQSKPNPKQVSIIIEAGMEVNVKRQLYEKENYVQEII